MSLDGTWNLKMNTPMGEQKSVVVLSGDGGTMTDPTGAPRPLTDLKVGADTATWKINVTVPMPMTVSFNLKLDGDKLVGTATTPMGGAPVLGVRA